MLTRAQTGFLEGWKVFHQIRLLFAVLLIAAMAINVAAFITAKYSRLTGAQAEPGQTAAAPAQPTTAPAENAASEIRWRMAFRIVMDITAVVAIVSAIFLVFCALLGVMMLIAGQLPGVGLVSAAFFWAILALVLLLPWCSLLPQVNCLPIGVPAFTDMRSNLQECQGPFCIAQVDLWLRYVVYPLVVILITVLYLGRTGQANKQLTEGPSAQDVLQQIK